MRHLTVIVSTDNRDGRFEKWLTHNAIVLRETQVVVVPWRNPREADHVQQITKLAMERDYLVCAPSPDTMFEANHNAGLRWASMHNVASDDQDLIAFVDDDIFLAEGWTEAIRTAAEANVGCALATEVVTLGTETRQGAGHHLAQGRPRDHGYQKPGEIAPPLDGDIVGPCANTAVLPWGAIRRIWAREGNPTLWDRHFEQWCTCFDVGLKLQLTGAKTVVAEAARAAHIGWISWTDADKERRGSDGLGDIAFKQLRARFRLYRKFLPPDEAARAIAQVRDLSLPKWKARGYVNFEKWVFGDEIEAVFARAEKAVRSIRPSETWRIDDAASNPAWF